MNLHEIEEQDFGRGPTLWGADPDICCACLQLGACKHTEIETDEVLAALFAEGADSAYYRQWSDHEQD